jgi:hypothetical protein
MSRPKGSTEMQQYLRGFNTIMLTVITASLIWFGKTMLETKENVSLIKQELGYIKRDVQMLQGRLEVQYTRDEIDVQISYLNERIKAFEFELTKLKNQN